MLAFWSNYFEEAVVGYRVAAAQVQRRLQSQGLLAELPDCRTLARLCAEFRVYFPQALKLERQLVRRRCIAAARKD